MIHRARADSGRLPNYASPLDGLSQVYTYPRLYTMHVEIGIGDVGFKVNYCSTKQSSGRLTAAADSYVRKSKKRDRGVTTG